MDCLAQTQGGPQRLSASLDRTNRARFVTDARGCIIRDDAGAYLSGLSFTYWIRYSIYSGLSKPLLSVFAYI